MSATDSKFVPGHLDRAALLALAGDGGGEPDLWAALSRLLAERYSCRAFRPDPVPRETVDRAVALAQMSASWCNTQPWEVHVTEGEITERFREALYAHGASGAASETDFDFPVRYSDTLKARRLETAWQLYEAVGIGWGDREGSRLQGLENFRLFGAPHVMLITSDADLGTYGGIDTGIFIGNLLLALQALGVGCVPQAALAVHSKFIRRYFGIGDHRRLVIGISFGWPDHDHASNNFRTLRAPPEGAIHWLDQTRPAETT